MNKKIIALSVFLLLMVSSAVAILRVNVYVSSSIDGRIPYFNIPAEVNNTPQSFLVVWENTGSVGCRFRLRADIYEIINSTKRQIYTSWSEEIPIEPGAQENLVAYWYPKSPGNFTVHTFIYYCNSIEDGPTGNFTVLKSNITTRAPFDVKTESTESYVEFRFNSREDINDLVIIPREYPLGWIFDSKRMGGIEKGREKIVRVNYEASIWKERNVSFDIVTLDGKFYKQERITLRKKREFPVYHAIIVILVVVIIILSIMLIRYRKRGVELGDREGSNGNSGSR